MDKIWLASYHDEIPEVLPALGFKSLREIIDHSFKEYADRPCYTNMGTTLTYSDLDRLSMQFASYLQNSLGLVKGERVAIMLPNILQYPVVLCGIFRAGLVAVNVNPLYTARELRHQLSDSGARCIVVLDNFACTLEEVISDTAVDHVVTTQVGDLLKFPKGLIVNFVLKRIKKAVPAYSLPGSVMLRKALNEGDKAAVSHVELGLADLAFLQYTGGTTGLSKGAMLSHRNMVSNVHQGLAWIGDTLGDKKDIVAITALPLYHIFSLQSNCLSIMVDGGENILITNPRDMPGFVKELSKHKFGYFTGVNTLFAGLLNTPGFAELDFSTLKITIGGGMAVQVKAATVTRAPIEETIPLVASVTANESVEVRSEIDGRVERIGFEEGKPVQAGQLLVQLDASKLSAQVAEAEANFKLADANRQRAETMLEKRTISVQEFDQARAAFETHRAALELMRRQLDDTYIQAPFEGLTGARLVSPGQVISRNTALTTLVDVTPVKIAFTVPERFLGQLALGQSIAFHVSAYRDERFEGEVYFIDPEVDPDTRTVQVKALQPNADGRLRPGMFGNLDLILRVKDDALLVPETALVLEGDRASVYRIDNEGKAQRVLVATGLRTDGKVEITDGIADGDAVISEGLQKLRPGVSVSTNSAGM